MRVARKRVELRAAALSQDKVLQLARELKRDTAFLLVPWRRRRRCVLLYSQLGVQAG